MLRARRLIGLILVLVLVLGVVAVAAARRHSSSGVSVSAAPLVQGAAAGLSLETSLRPATHGELSSVELDLARGFRFDPRAADTCSDAQAHAGRCPATSTIGRGTGTIVVSGTFLPRTPYRVNATFYEAKPRDRGDIAGLVLDLYETQSQLHATVLGRVIALHHGPYGLALRFSGTDKELPAGYDLSLLRLTTLLQAQRTVAVGGVPVTDSLLTNPAACTSTGWPVQLRVTSAGQSQAYRASAGCKR